MNKSRKAFRGEADEIRGETADTLGPDLTQSLQVLSWLKIPKLRAPSLIVIGVLGFYAIWAGYHFQELADASQKELAHAAEVLDGAIDTARRNIEELDPTNPGYLTQFLREQPYLAKADKSNTIPNKPHKIEYRSETSGLILELHRDDKDKSDPLPFRFRSEKLLAELTFPASFRTLALVKDSGEVIASMPVQGNAWRRRLRFNETRNREDRFGDDPAWPAVDLKAAMDGRAGKEVFKSLGGAASRTRTEIGGTTYELYLQPLRLRTGGAERIYLAGLTPSSAVLRQAMAMDTFLLAAACLALAILMVGMPFVKLFVLHARERFRVFDLKSLYISTGALLTLATTVLMTASGYLSFETAAESIQQELHRSLAQKFTAELREARAQLDSFNAACAKPIDFKDTSGAKAVAVDQIAWISNDAMQTSKFTPTDERAENLGVGHREYFRAVATNTLFRLRDDPPGANPFFFGPARSISDGQFYSFLSTKSNENCGKGVIAAAMTFPLFSLGERPLPAGFGFALIHRDGTVLYHSDGRLALRENLLDEVSRDARLRAVVLADQSNEFDSGYHGTPHHFHVAPVAEITSATGPPFVLLTFHELTPGRYVAAHAFLSALLWTMAPLFLWMALAIYAAGRVTKVRSGAKDDNGTRWIWTQSDRTNDYRQAALLIAAIGMFALVLAAFHVYQGTLLAALLTPFIAIWFVVWKAPGEGTRDRASHWHVWLVIAIAVTMNVVPAIGVQRIIWGHEAGKFVEYSNTQAREREADLPEEWAAKLRAESVFANRVAHAKSVRSAQLKNPVEFGPSVDWPLSGLEWMRPLQDRLAWHLPLRNDTAIGLRGRAGKMFAPPVSGWLLLVLGFGGAGFLLWFWVRWNATHLLLAGTCTETVNTALDWSKLTDDQRLLLVQIDREGIAHPRHRELILELCNNGWLCRSPQLAPTVDIAKMYAADVARVSELEAPGEGQGWSGMAGSILAALIAAVLFLASTQPELPFDFGLLLSMLTTSVSGVMKRYEQLAQWMKPGSE